ncbi:amidase [Prescottella agglutinans]|uniref:amidase n=1 Tax=Prescottella agglutinans TaxID=1644129 RepID=A0ABT6MD63_9NOCA|nr:amidase [Prescottella agglutinans]MDH6282257.1 amidase [Prescottella agglutinans]
MADNTRIHAFRDDALGDLDATGVAARIAAGEVSAREAVEAAIDRAESVQGVLNGIQTRDFERALRQADAPRGGVFSGVPTIVKDNVDAAGLPTGQGSAAFTPAPARRHSDFVEQFLSTGAVSIGKSRLPEFGFSASTEYADADPVRNPWNPEYSSGASSGGSAALVAAGVLPFAHANDGGGSIRIPSAACGLVGLKPTRGRTVPDATDKTMPIRIVAQGVVTRSVRDSARFYAAAENYYRNPKFPPIRLVERPGSTRLRVGVIVDSVTGVPTDVETRDSVRSTADLLDKLGHHVEEATLPVGEEFMHDFKLYWGFLSFALLTGGKRMFGPTFDPAKTDNLSRGLDAMYRKRMIETPRMLYRMQRTARTYARMFQTYDVVLSPVLSHTTPKLGYLSPAQDFDTLFDRLVTYAAFTPLNNASGGPAISLPLHQTSTGLPLASHFSAAHGDERTLLELAFELEAEEPWARIQDPA